MLSEAEIEEIRQGIRHGRRGPILLTWVEKLLRDRDERIKLNQEIAARLLGSQGQPRRRDRS